MIYFLRIVYFICFFVPLDIGFITHNDMKTDIFCACYTCNIDSSSKSNDTPLGYLLLLIQTFSINSSFIHYFYAVSIVYGIFLCVSVTSKYKQLARICTKSNRKSYAKEPSHNNPYLAIKLKEEYFKELEESCAEEELQKGKEIALNLP